MIFAQLLYFGSIADVVTNTFFVPLDILCLKFGVFPFQILMQLSLLKVLFVQGIVTLLYGCNILKCFGDFFLVVFPRSHAGDIVVDGGVGVNGTADVLEFFIRDILCFKLLKNGL